MVIARVNGYKILHIEYQAELQSVLGIMHLEQPNSDVKKRAIEQLIDGYLLLQQAKQYNIEISVDEVDQRLLEFTMDYDSEEEFQEYLSSHNINLNKLREKIKNEFYIRNYVKTNFSPAVKIPNSKLEEVYLENKEAFVTQKMVKASHILIKGTDEESLLKVKKIRAMINSPEDFIREAESCSDCPSSCQCGDLGYFTLGKMVKNFEDIAFSLQINEISQPVKTQFGYHIIMVTDHKKSKTASFEEVKGALKKRLQQIDSELQLIRHLKELRANAEIEIYHELL